MFLEISCPRSARPTVAYRTGEHLRTHEPTFFKSYSEAHDDPRTDSSKKTNTSEVTDKAKCIAKRRHDPGFETHCPRHSCPRLGRLSVRPGTRRRVPFRNYID